MTDALMILRTPLQAHLAHQVLSLEGITDYDLIYFTQNNSEEDRLYFSRLSTGSGYRRYIFNRSREPDIVNHLMFRFSLRNCFIDFKRCYVIIGSVDAPVIRALLQRQKTSTLLTIDDGSANINKLSIYHDRKRSWRYRAYSYLLHSEPIEKVYDRIRRHYTLFCGIENIVEEERLCYLPSVCPEIRSARQDGSRTYYVGQPIPSKHRDAMTATVKEILGDQKIDLYVRHPREELPLDIDAPFLDKKGLIAEEAILRDAAGRAVNIISGFSTATLNLAPFVRSANIIIHPGIDQGMSKEIERLAKLVGCTVHRLHENNLERAGERG